MSKPIDIGYNTAVLHIAGKVAPRGFKIVERWADTPDTYLDLCKWAERDGQITCTTEGGIDTIYGDAEVYAHFRGWHDTAHYREGLDFTIAGEAAATYVQCAEITKVFGRNDRAARFCAMVLQDIMGQQLYKAKHGAFPEDPVALFYNDYGSWVRLGMHLNETLTSTNHAVLIAEDQYGFSGGVLGASAKRCWVPAAESVGG